MAEHHICSATSAVFFCRCWAEWMEHIQVELITECSPLVCKLEHHAACLNVWREKFRLLIITSIFKTLSRVLQSFSTCPFLQILWERHPILVPSTWLIYTTAWSRTKVSLNTFSLVQYFMKVCRSTQNITYITRKSN